MCAHGQNYHKRLQTVSRVLSHAVCGFLSSGIGLGFGFLCFKISKLFKLGKQSVFFLFVLFVISCTAESVPPDKQEYGDNHANYKSPRGLHKHCNPSGTDNFKAGIDARQILGRNGKLILGIIIVTLCFKGDFTVFLYNLNNTVGGNGCTVSLGVEKGNNITFFNLLGLYRFNKNQVAAAKIIFIVAHH